jgi:hypothetical protein
MDDVDRIFYLIPKRRGDGENIDLFLPGDLIAQEDGEVAPSLGFGVFAFLRNARNRGKPRYLSFPAVIGFGEDSRVVDLTLQSDYIKTRMGNANRFSFVEDATTRQLGIEASFAARKFPPPFQLAGVAAKLASYSLWALIPEDREHLETLWAQRAFYLIGHGALGDNRNVSNG